MNTLAARKQRVKKRVRSRIVRQSEYPRLSVHRSNKHISVQVIDDYKNTTVAAASDVKIADKKTNIEKAQMVGKMVGEQLLKLGVKQVVFDRGNFQYKGRIKALAESVRGTGVTI